MSEDGTCPLSLYESSTSIVPLYHHTSIQSMLCKDSMISLIDSQCCASADHLISEQEPIIEKRIGQDTIRITPIPVTITAAHISQFIHDIIGKWVLWIGIHRKQQQLLRGYKGGASDDAASSANIRFEDEGDAFKFAAILEDKFNNYMFNIRVLVYKHPKGYYKTHSMYSNMQGTTNWVRITNLDRKCKDEDIQQMIQSRGRLKNKILGIHLRHHFKYENYPSFCEVECSTKRDAVSLVRNLRMKEFKGRSMWVEYRRPPNAIEHDLHSKSEAKTTRVRIAGLHQDIQNKQIRSLCKSYGKVVGASHERGIDDYPSGQGYVEMSTPKEARMVHAGLHGMVVNNLTLYTFYPRNALKRFNAKKHPHSQSQEPKKRLCGSLLRKKKNLKRGKSKLLAGMTTGNNKRARGTNNLKMRQRAMKNYKKSLKKAAIKKANWSKTYGGGRKLGEASKGKFKMVIKMDKDRKKNTGPKKA